MPEYPRSPFKKTGTSVTPKVSGDVLDATTIGSTTPAAGSFTTGIFSGLVSFANDVWTRAKNYAGTDYINMFKVTEGDEISVGGTLVIGASLEAAINSGPVVLADMLVTDASDDGDEMSFTVGIDGDNILKVYAESNGAGGVDTHQVRPLRPMVYAQTPQTLTGAGAVDIITQITHIVTGAADALTLVDGANGQEKFITMKTHGGNGTLTPTSLGNGTTITFSAVGDSAHLIFTNGSWHFMGGTATLA